MRVKRIHLLIFGLIALKVLYALTRYYFEELGFGIYYLGGDEGVWQEGSIYFFENGLGLDTMKGFASTRASFLLLGWPFLVGITHLVLGLSYLNVLWLKMLLFLLAAKGLYALIISKRYSIKIAYFGVIFLAIYEPLIKSDISYMRDDFIVYLIIILLWLIQVIPMVKSILLRIFSIIIFLFLSYILAFTRPFAILVMVSLQIFYFGHIKFKYFVLTGLIILFLDQITLYFGLFDLIRYSLEFVGRYELHLIDQIFLIFKYYIGPLPWNMIGIDSGVNPLWYGFTLILILFGFTRKEFYHQFFINWKVIIALFITGCLPYMISHQEVNAVGPRQFAMVGPFLFIILYNELLSKVKFDYNKS